MAFNPSTRSRGRNRLQGPLCEISMAGVKLKKAIGIDTLLPSSFAEKVEAGNFFGGRGPPPQPEIHHRINTITATSKCPFECSVMDMKLRNATKG